MPVQRLFMNMMMMQIMVHRMDDRSRSHKQQSLEEGVRHQVEDAGPEGGDAASQKHGSPTAKSLNKPTTFLDIELRQTRCGGEQSGGRFRWRRQRIRKPAPEHIEYLNAPTMYTPAVTIVCRVDQGGNRPWDPAHGVGKPDVEAGSAPTCRQAPTKSSSVNGCDDLRRSIGKSRSAFENGGIMKRAERGMYINSMPRRKPKSPMRLTTEAFMPALAFVNYPRTRIDQKIAAENRPPSQPTDEHQEIAVSR